MYNRSIDREKFVVDGVDGSSQLVALDKARDADLGRADDFDIDVFSSERAEHFCGDAGGAEHACADDRDLSDVLVDSDAERLQFLSDALDDGFRLCDVILLDGEDDIGDILLDVANALNDHIDIDVGVGECGENLMSDARLIGDAEDGELSDLLVVSDAANDKTLLLHSVVLPDDGAGRVGEGGADVDGDVEVLTDFDRAGLHDSGAEPCHFEHLVIGDLAHFASALDDARVGGVDSVDIGEDLARVGFEGACESDGGGIGAAATESDGIAELINALEACGDDDFTLIELVNDAGGIDAEDASLGMIGGGAHTDLGAGERNGGLPKFLERHGEQSDGDLFAGGEKHIHLAGVGGLIRLIVDALREGDQIVGGIAHSGDDDDDLIVGMFIVEDSISDVEDFISGRDGAAAEFLNNESQIATTSLRDLWTDYISAEAINQAAD